MGKKVPDAVIDTQLDLVEGDTIYICSAEPIDYADLVNVTLASQTIVGSNTKANGDVSGRKTTWPQQVDVPISADGIANHVAKATVGATRLEHVTTTPDQSLTSGGTVTVNAHSHEIGDPT